MRLILTVIGILLLCKVLVVTSVFSSNRTMSDFDNYYHTVSDLKKGLNPYQLDYMQTLGPPLVFLYYLPFSFLTLPTAQLVFLLTNIIAGYLCCLVLAFKFFPKNKYVAFWALSSLLYLSFLSRYSLQIGQPILLIALLIGAQSLPLLISLKTFFAFAWLAQPSIKNLMLSILILLTSFLIIRPSWYVYYSQNKFFQNVSAQENTTQLNYENQTLRSTLARLKLQVSYPYVWVTLFLVGLFVTLKTRNFYLGILFSFILSPVLWQHYFIALFPIFVFALKGVKTKKSKILLLLSFVLWWPDLRFLHTAPATIINGILASHFYFSLVLLTLVVLLNLRHELFSN